MVQTAEGALTEVHAMLQRIRELAVEAGNSTVGTADATSINAEITALQSEINRIAQKTTFNGQFLLTGALSVAKSGGTLSVGTALSTGHAATVSAIDVSGAKAGSTYTLSSAGGAGTLTLSDGVGNFQQVTLSQIGATGTETMNFGILGVKITVVGAAAKTAAELSTDLATTGVTHVITIGGSSGTDLVNGDTIRQTDPTPVLVQGVMYYPSGAIDGPAPTAVASTGVAAGTITLSVTPLGHMTGSLGGEAFAGDLAPFIRNHSDTIVLNGSRGNTITLTYHQHSTAGTLADEATDFTGSQITFVAGPGTATVSGMTVDPATPAGTYAFTSSGAGSLTLNGTTVAVTNMGANEVRALTFGNISFTLTADANGMSAASIVSNLLQPANDTVVVTDAGSPGAPGTITTGASMGATFQVGANEGDTLGVNFTSAQTAVYTGFDGAVAAFTGALSTSTAGSLITAADTAIAYISGLRGSFGAVENRLTHTIGSISTASENLTASQSRIKDLDVAAEMLNFTKTQVLQQAGVAILAQANQAPQSILALLR